MESEMRSAASVRVNARGNITFQRGTTVISLTPSELEKVQPLLAGLIEQGKKVRSRVDPVIVLTEEEHWDECHDWDKYHER